MKRVVLILGVLLALAGVGCGDGGETDTQTDELSALAQKFLNAPEVEPPEGPPPNKVVIKEVKPGSGEIAKKGDQVLVHYRGIDYGSGKEVYFEWRPRPPIPYPRLGFEEGEPGLQQGIVGMREGGRREVIVPARLASINKPLVYLVELVSVKPAAQ